MTQETFLNNVDFINSGLGYGHSVDKMHENRATGNKITTALWVIVAIIFIGIFASLFFRRFESGKTTEKNTDISLGENGEAIESLKFRVARVEGYERADYGDIQFNKGMEFSEQYYGGRGGYRRGGCGNEHHGHCGKKFVRQDTYTPNTQQVIVTEDCNCGC